MPFHLRVKLKNFDFINSTHYDKPKNQQNTIVILSS
jgi:hypothetical protein